MRIVFDLEANGLLPEATKIWCMSTYDIDTHEVLTFTQDSDIIATLMGSELLIGFNIMGYDLPLIEKIYGTDVKCLTKLERSFDLWEAAITLNPNRLNNVDAWAGRLGIQGKIVIDDWEHLPLEAYIERCEQDVKIEYRIYLAMLAEMKVTDYKDIFNAK